MVEILPSTRVRVSPFYESTLAEGMVSAAPYNSMLLPGSYGDPEAEYWRLIEGVSQWDVGVERQIQLQGPDAATLAQMLCARDLSKCKVGRICRVGFFTNDHSGKSVGPTDKVRVGHVYSRTAGLAYPRWVWTCQAVLCCKYC